MAANNDLTKKPYLDESLSKTQTAELALSTLDPKFFIKNFCYIQHPTKGRMQFKLYDFQEGLVDAYHNYRSSIAMLPRQMGKALDVETDILTPNGFVKLDDLKVNDIIYGEDGKETTITAITDTMYDHDCYEVTFDNGDSIIADAEHLWTVSSSNWTKDNQRKTMTTEELIPYLEHTNKPYVSIQKTLDFKSQHVEIDPYELGMWLGDGHADGRRVTCAIEDFKIYEHAGIVSKVLEYSVNNDTTRVFNINSPMSSLRKYNLIKNKHIPSEYVFNDVNTRLQLLRGLMDSDGSVATASGSGRCEFYQKSYEFIKSFRFLLSTLGIKSKVTQKIVNGETYYTVGFVTNYSVFNLPRKKELQRGIRHPKSTRLYLRTIEPVESRPVKCLTVDNEDHMFLAGRELIPTHNSTVAAAYLLWYAMFNDDQTILIAAHKYSGAQEIMSRIRYMYESCPDHIRCGVTEYNKGSITFDNGSRIIGQATTENTGRGLSISLLYCDEFAFVRPRIADEFWTSISPTLSTGGKCLMTSTPNLYDDLFAQIWSGANKTVDEYGNETETGINGFKAFQAYWQDHPDRDEEWAKVEEGKIGTERFKREFECLTYENSITLENSWGDVFTMEIGELFEQLKKYRDGTP